MRQFARLEHLTSTERQIYIANKAPNDADFEEEAQDAVARWKKALAVLCLAALILFPIFYLLLFGLQYDSATTRSWWLSTIFCTVLTLCVYEPLLTLFFMVVLPDLLRHKLKRLIDPSAVSTFPFSTPLREFPTSYLAEKHSHLHTSRHMIQRRNSSRKLLTNDAVRVPNEHHAFAMVRLDKITARMTIRLILALWGVLLLLPDTIREFVLDQV